MTFLRAACLGAALAGTLAFIAAITAGDGFARVFFGLSAPFWAFLAAWDYPWLPAESRRMKTL